MNSKRGLEKSKPSVSNLLRSNQKTFVRLMIALRIATVIYSYQLSSDFGSTIHGYSIMEEVQIQCQSWIILIAMKELIILNPDLPSILELPLHCMSGLTVLHAVKDNGKIIVLRI